MYALFRLYIHVHVVHIEIRYSFTFSLLYALETFSNWKSFDFIILLLPKFGSILLEFTISLKLTLATLTSRLKPLMVLKRFIFDCSALKILLKLWNKIIFNIIHICCYFSLYMLKHLLFTKISFKFGDEITYSVSS